MRKQGMSTEANANEETSGRGILIQRHILDILSMFYVGNMIIESFHIQTLILVSNKRTSADAKIGDIKLDNSDSEEETPDEVRLNYHYTQSWSFK